MDIATPDVLDEIRDIIGNGFENDSVGSVQDIGYYASVTTADGRTWCYVQDENGDRIAITDPLQIMFSNAVAEYDDYYDGDE